MTKTPIEWADWSSNPLRYRTADGRVVWACEKISAGCQHCYAEALSHRYGGIRRAGEWNAATMATLTPFLDDAELRRMLHDKRISGKRVFLGDMTDIFGAWVADELLDRLFAVFALRPDVTWQVLTKRAERMRAYFAAGQFRDVRVADAAKHLHTLPRPFALPSEEVFDGRRVARGEPWMLKHWPLPNVWLGVSAENQEQADARIPHLLRTPATVRFVSAEPLLGPVDLGEYLDETEDVRCCGNDGCEYCDGTGTTVRSLMHWVIAGGESGMKARHCHTSWVRWLVEQCAARGTACFVKQMGTCVIERNDRLASDRPAADPDDWPEPSEGWDDSNDGNLIRLDDGYQGAPVRVLLQDRKGGDPSEWPLALRVREFPGEVRS